MIIEGNCKICNKFFKRRIAGSRKGSYYCSYSCYWKTLLKKDVGYNGIHRWLRITFGWPNKCENIGCLKKSKSYDWALLKGKSYKRKRENFLMLCRSCHIKYDMTDERRKNISKGTLKGLKLKVR